MRNLAVATPEEEPEPAFARRARPDEPTDKIELQPELDLDIDVSDFGPSDEA